MSDATWFNIDTGSLTTEQQAAYAEYKDAQRKAAALREAFEDSITASADIPQGMRMVFGYRFGKLSAALVEDDRKPSKAKQQTRTLADFLAAQAASGRAV